MTIADGYRVRAEVPVLAGASLRDRLLGYVGRDPVSKTP
ncbi:hypothetical protein SAMN05216553_110242 [Lentzea fradiae]|uniref:Uncharacterized protein n=1 Tax=Lentzea fradiae TaxID=200378 RepID=A0A1G7W9W5_9PSEU|nr:hypothetical protein SAMN05216553_110242 [Lentzea fradiae]